MTQPPRRHELTPDEQEHYRYIGREWKRIQWCMYDERISAMFAALKDGCTHPDDPTDSEAGHIRMALVAEIEALGIESHEPVVLP